MFGASTLSAVTTFQACCGLPETGVCDVETWTALLGPKAQPQDIENVFSGDSDDEDLEEQGVGRVYLLGEQRWSLPAKKV
jgi:peptidoglycan hydrolase-like protein with peptidoglycan-binding domain